MVSTAWVKHKGEERAAQVLLPPFCAVPAPSPLHAIPGLSPGLAVTGLLAFQSLAFLTALPCLRGELSLRDRESRLSQSA